MPINYKECFQHTVFRISRLLTKQSSTQVPEGGAPQGVETMQSAPAFLLSISINVIEILDKLATSSLIPLSPYCTVASLHADLQAKRSPSPSTSNLIVKYAANQPHPDGKGFYANHVMSMRLAATHRCNTCLIRQLALVCIGLHASVWSIGLKTQIVYAGIIERSSQEASLSPRSLSTCTYMHDVCRQDCHLSLRSHCFRPQGCHELIRGRRAQG